MTTRYTQSLTVAVPRQRIEVANHLACLIGERAADIRTFSAPSYMTAQAKYAVAHTVCTVAATDALAAMSLPPDPDHVPQEYDRAKAEQAFYAIEDGEILVAVNVDPHDQVAIWGLTRIPEEDSA